MSRIDDARKELEREYACLFETQERIDDLDNEIFALRKIENVGELEAAKFTKIMGRPPKDQTEDHFVGDEPIEEDPNG